MNKKDITLPPTYTSKRNKGKKKDKNITVPPAFKSKRNLANKK